MTYVPSSNQPSTKVIFNLTSRNGRGRSSRSPGRIRSTLALALAGLFIFSTVTFRSFAQQNRASLDPEGSFLAKSDKLLKLVRRAAEKDRNAETQGPIIKGQSQVDRLSHLTNVHRNSNGSVGINVMVGLTQNSSAELDAANFAVGARIGDVASVRTTVDRLPELASLATVRRVSATVYRHPSNDRARQAIGVDNSSGQRVVSQTGRGIVVGIIDSGIDFRNQDFTKPGSSGKQTRIKALLDMTLYGTASPDPGWNYTLPGGTAVIGHLYTEADLNTALQSAKPVDQATDPVKERDSNGHGTHVTGTAAGNGLNSPTPGVYAGMAPEADLVIVKASTENDGNAGFADDNILNALKFIQQKATELNEPFVINMSLGGNGGSPHDGTDPDERAIDSIVNGGTGRAVCVAAGNDGESGKHASGTVPNGGDVTLGLTDTTTNPGSFTLYYPNLDRFSITVTLPDGSTLSSGPFNGTPVENKSLLIFSGTDDKQDTDPSNDQSSIFIIFKKGAEKLGSTPWSFKVHGDTVTSGGHFDVWLDDNSFTNFVDDSHLVSSPGTSRGAITVGAYVTRSATQTIGNFAFFTSPGPTADGRQKPDISAPGYYLYSSKSSDIGPNGITSFTYGNGSNAPAPGTDVNKYGGLAGTSMATPVTTGAVALLLQSNKNLSIDQIKSFIFNNSLHDGFDSPGWNARFGNGKLNIAAAIGAAQLPPNQIDDAQFFVTQHYRDFLNREPDSAGLQYWTEQITGNSSNNPPPCAATDSACVNSRRIGVSAAFFIELEFQKTGSYVYRMYKAAFGTRPSYTRFTSDRGMINSDASQIDASKQNFADQFVAGSDFVAMYPASLSGSQFIDNLVTNVLNNSGVDLSGQKAALNADFNVNHSRGRILRLVAENTDFANAEYNKAFVLMQYFGYLKREPDAAGYNFWLDVLNNKVPGNFRGMVCAFITSAEYQLRFGTNVTRSNRECS